MARVEITTFGHSIVIDADGPLDQVAGKALYLWTRTRDPREDRVISTGFSASLERSDGPSYEAEHPGILRHPSTGKAGGGWSRPSDGLSTTSLTAPPAASTPASAEQRSSPRSAAG